MRRNRNAFILLFIFFIAVAVGSLLGLNGKSSVFDRDINTLGAKNAVMNEAVIGTEPTASEASSEELLEIVAKPYSEPKTVDETESLDDEARFFTFKVNTKYTVLRLREEPSLEGNVIDRLLPGTTGYVLESGDEWCRVYVEQSDETGYVATEYIEVSEITKEELPEDIREQVKSDG